MKKHGGRRIKTTRKLSTISWLGPHMFSKTFKKENCPRLASLNLLLVGWSTICSQVRKWELFLIRAI